jgi:peptidoglycan L-alanyl-D-glutamate endopeptidase CwlK
VVEVDMPKYSDRSRLRLETCDYRIQQVFFQVIKEIDCTIIEGYRPSSKQAELVKLGKSKVFVSKHNEQPSEAVDVAPYIKGVGIPWPDKEKSPDTYIKDLAAFYFFAGYVLKTAKTMGVQLRWGGDWDGDFSFTDQDFDDLVHFELK